MSYIFLDRTNFPKPIHQGSGSLCSSSLRTWTDCGCLQTLQSFNPLLFIVRLTKIRLALVFFQPLFTTCGYQDHFLVFSGNCSLPGWTSFSIHGISFLKYFQKSVDGNSFSTLFWILPTTFTNISSSFKNIIFNDRFFSIGEDHASRRMTPTN